MIIKSLLCLTALCVFTTAVAAEDPRVSEAIRGLASEDPGTESKSIAYLKDHYAEAKPIMLAAFDEFDEFSAHVRYAFYLIGERSVPDLIAAFEGAGKTKKLHLASTLGDLKEKAKAAVPTLHAQLDDKDRSVRFAVLEALGSIGDPSSVPVLVKHLRDKDNGIRSAAIGSLAQIGPEVHPFAAEIIEYVKNEREDEQDRKNAAEGMLYTRYYSCMQSAQHCLGTIGRRAIPFLEKEIVNRNNPTRQRMCFLEAIQSMANWAEKSDAVLAIPTLRKVVDDPNPEVRSYGLGVLGVVCHNCYYKIEPDKDLGWLFAPEAIKKMSVSDRLEAAYCAARFKKYRGLAITLIDEGLRSPDKSIIRQAIGGVPDLDNDRGAVAPALIRVMQHADAEIRRAAIERINGDLRFIAALPILEDVVKNDKDKWCRREAAKKIEIIKESIVLLPIPSRK